MKTRWALVEDRTDYIICCGSFEYCKSFACTHDMELDGEYYLAEFTVEFGGELGYVLNTYTEVEY